MSWFKRLKRVPQNQYRKLQEFTFPKTASGTWTWMAWWIIVRLVRRTNLHLSEVLPSFYKFPYRETCGHFLYKGCGKCERISVFECWGRVGPRRGDFCNICKGFQRQDPLWSVLTSKTKQNNQLLNVHLLNNNKKGYPLQMFQHFNLLSFQY